MRNQPTNTRFNAITTSFKTSKQFQDTTANPVQAWTAPMGSRRLRLPEFLDSRHMTVARLSAPCNGRLYSQEISLVFTCVSPSQGRSAAWRISIENPIDPIGNRTRDPPSCSAVPEPTEFQHTSRHKWLHMKGTMKLRDIISSNFLHNVNSTFCSHSKIFEPIKVTCLFMHTHSPIFISLTMYQNKLLVKMSYQLQPNRAGTEHYVTRRYKSSNSRPLLSQW